MRIITLLYHDVVEPGREEASGFPGPAPGAYKLFSAQFAQHLDAIAAVVSQPASPIDALLRRPQLPADWLITFDDGGASAHSHIAPMLEARGWRGHFFITTDLIGSPAFLSPEQIRDLRRRGHVIGSHSASHPMRMANCSRTQLLEEWRRSVLTLADLLGEPVPVASVPGGYFSRTVAETAAAAGIEVLFNSEPVQSSSSIDGCLILGRYSIIRSTPVSTAAAFARGSFPACASQFLFWNTKKVAKRLGGRYYLKFRDFAFSRRSS